VHKLYTHNPSKNSMTYILGPFRIDFNGIIVGKIIELKKVCHNGVQKLKHDG